MSAQTESQTPAALIARIAMVESEDTVLSLPSLLARAKALEEKPECLKMTAFDQLEDAKKWALLISALCTPLTIIQKYGLDVADAVEDVVEEAEKARTREDDLREEIDAYDREIENAALDAMYDEEC